MQPVELTPIFFEPSYSEEHVHQLIVEVLRDPNRQIELMAESFCRSLCRDLYELFQIEMLAREILARPFESFTNQHKTARTFLTVDAPRKRQRLHAALHILDFAFHKMRSDFILGDPATRSRLIEFVIKRGGIYHYRSNAAPVWRELVT